MRTWLMIASLSLALGSCNLFAPAPEPEPEPNSPPPAVQPEPETPPPQPQPPPPPEPPSPLPRFTEPAVIPDQKAEKQTRVHTLAEDETSYVWTHYCGGQKPPPSEDPFGSPDFQTLLISYGEWRSYQHLALFRLPLHLLPQKIEKASVELFCSQDSGEKMDIDVYCINEPWTWPNQNEPWRAVCQDSFPDTSWTDGVWSWDNTPHTNQWFQINLTDTYNFWTDEWDGPKPNYGMVVTSDTWHTWAEFHSSNYGANPALRPRIVLEYYPPVPRRLVFPLAGKYSPTRVKNGYRFGDWWEKKTCLNLDVPLLHTGTDFTAKSGDRVSAAATGKVKLARPDLKQGGYVALECRDQDADGDNFLYTFAYTHVTPNAGLLVDQWVMQGDPLGVVSNIAGAHLHLQVRMAPYHERWSIIGRLPLISCTTAKGQTETEPAFSFGFFDPENLDWE